MASISQRAPDRTAAAPATARPPSRVVIENLRPQIDSGRFPVKRTLGEALVVSVDAHAGGHDTLSAVLRFRRAGEKSWREARMQNLGNDSWTGRFEPDALGRWEYSVLAWVDVFANWQEAIARKLAAEQTQPQDFAEGAELIARAISRARGADAVALRRCLRALRGREAGTEATAASLAALMLRHDERAEAVADRVFEVVVDRKPASFSAWYEMFPRSAGTFRQAEARLPEIARMGFDVLYLPPIHPIGESFRKGPNNDTGARPGDPGCPWAIGSKDGDHTAVHPELGSLSDFDHFVAAADARGLEVALDLAFQCSPDHPWVREHPEWFLHRPDGSIKYAENPPKKYEDTYPLDFHCASWQALWRELREVVFFWVGHGVKIFRADNPHTKPYAFWEWLIKTVQARHPDVLFLAEAFTRPKVMRYLAKCGFSQSYTYFTWRNTKAELTDYLVEMTRTEMKEYFRPNFFVNTPDIFHEYLQKGGRPAHQIRLVLAATLSGSYGIYGPAFELCEGDFIPGTEDYKNSEKYQIRRWDLARPGHIKEFIARVNAIRKGSQALRRNDTLRFLETDNEQLLAYAKWAPDFSEVLLIVVNLDPRGPQSGWVRVPWDELGLEASGGCDVVDLLGPGRYSWRGAWNYVRLDPAVCPAHILRVDRGPR